MVAGATVAAAGEAFTAAVVGVPFEAVAVTAAATAAMAVSAAATVAMDIEASDMGMGLV